MEFIKTEISEVYIIKPKVFGDERGYFMETFKDELFRKEVCDTTFVQDNESKSKYGVLRGLHYQLPPFAQSKLVRVLQGKVLDVAVDIRKDSPTFGKYVSVELSEENKLQFFIPRGFAHGFVVLSDSAVFAYKVDNLYAPNSEASIKFDDPELNISWRLNPSEMIVSEKDAKAKKFSEAILFDSNEKLY